MAPPPRWSSPLSGGGPPADVVLRSPADRSFPPVEPAPKKMAHERCGHRPNHGADSHRTEPLIPRGQTGTERSGAAEPEEAWNCSGMLLRLMSTWQTWFRPAQFGPGRSGGKRPLRDSATLSFLARRCRPLPPPLVPGAVGRARTRSTPGPLEGETTMNSVAPMGRLNPDRGSHPVL